MKENPASSSAFRFAADNIPASATTTRFRPVTSNLPANASSTGKNVLVSALFPSKQWIASGNPVVVTSKPTRICGSTRRSLLIPTLRRSSSCSASNHNVVQSYMIIAKPAPPAVTWSRHAASITAR